MAVKPAQTKIAKAGGRAAKIARLAATGRLGRGPSAVLEEARTAGLLDGDKTQHVSFRAPEALLQAAMRESGVSTPTELGLLALALLAQPDPVAAFMRETRGALGPDHELDY